MDGVETPFEKRNVFENHPYGVVREHGLERMYVYAVERHARQHHHHKKPKHW